MKLKIRRSQKSGMLGGIKFEVTVQAEFTRDEQALVTKYKLGLYPIFQHEPDESNSTRVYLICPEGLAKQVVHSCSHPDEAQWFEENIVKGCQDFQSFLSRIETFDGREVILDLSKDGPLVDTSRENHPG